MTSVTENAAEEKNEESCAWYEHRFGNMISLEGIANIVDLTPSAKSKIFASFDSIPSDRDAIYKYVYAFGELVKSNLKCKKVPYMFLFNKWELINWMEKEAESDPDFMYMLPQDFV